MRIFVPLQSNTVALLWGGLSLSALGNQLYTIALTWFAVSVLGSNAGYLSALQALVALLAVFCIGQWLDRWNRQRSMVGADLIRALVLIAVVVGWLTEGGPSVAGLVAAVVVLAIGQSVFQPALQIVLPSLIDDARLLPAANGLFDATDRSTRLLEPDLVALLAGIVPVVHFLTFVAMTFVSSAAALLLITRLRGRSVAIHRPRQPGIWRDAMRARRACARPMWPPRCALIWLSAALARLQPCC